jgi:NAD+ synthase (glutamine-hydrolysing)
MGDITGNKVRIWEYSRKAAEARADIVAFPEMAITGYPPLDLLPPREVRPPAGTRRPEQEDFVRINKKSVLELANDLPPIKAVIGFVDYDDVHLFNAAAIVEPGRIVGVTYKTLLPTYDVFDELRYFIPARGNAPIPISIRGQQIALGVSICEDLWDEEIGYSINVTRELCAQGAQMIMNVNASPYHDKIRETRLRILRKKVEKERVPIFYVNMVGGQDELVFDGESLALDANGKLIGLGKKFEEDLVLMEIDLPQGTGLSAAPEPQYHREREMFDALVLGVRDYFRKTGFRRALIGLSGGIDSSLVAVIASEALGKENVTGISMPSRYSSEHSKTDARNLSENLGIKFKTIPIEHIFTTYEQQLSSDFEQRPPDVAEENLQSRIRGNILMALSNKLGQLVLATGNKTELALGYATLYGDMSGGIEVIGDVSKMEVYALARYYNQKTGQAIIPASCFTKIPSAELKPNQFDPFDYSIVSPLVDEIVENRLSRSELIQKGFEEDVVEDTLQRIRLAEYKRRQAAPTIKITRKAFGMGWRMPLVNKFSPPK